jgi:hypothetical protein
MTAKKNNNVTLMLIAAFVLVASCLCCLIISQLPTPSSAGTSNPFSSNVEVKYIISGTTSSAFVTYFNETGGTEQINAAIPWGHTSIGKHSPIPLSSKNIPVTETGMFLDGCYFYVILDRATRPFDNLTGERFA